MTNLQRNDRLYEDEALWTRVQQTAQSYVLDHFFPQRMKIRLLDILNFSRKPPEKETADLNSVEHVQDTGSPNDATDRTWSDVARDKADCENWKLLFMGWSSLCRKVHQSKKLGKYTPRVGYNSLSGGFALSPSLMGCL